ncbi:hypothetical protein PENTCL1PPCAC_18791, partial [Pristionchus entomophagus]
SHDEYMNKLHCLAEHIKANPDEARCGVARLSVAARKPAGDIIKTFVSDKDTNTKYDAIQKIKDYQSAPVRAEIESFLAEIAHEIGILTIHEIIERLEILADYIKANPEEAYDKVATLSPKAQKPFIEMVNIFCSDQTPREKYEQCRKIKDSLPSDVIGEINVLKEEIAETIGIVPLQFQ